MDQAHLLQGIGFWMILVLCISVHEWAHAFTSDKLGDPTPRMQGRVTLNPVAHISLIGTVIIPLAMILLSPGFGLIGWGKPVQINPRFYKNKVRDDILVTLAGPGSNLVLAFLVSVVSGIVLRFVSYDVAERLSPLIQQMIFMNCILVAFNLIPIPPLDGSRVMRHMINMTEEAFMKFAQYGFIILIILINIPGFTRALFTVVLVIASPFFAIVNFLAHGA